MSDLSFWDLLYLKGDLDLAGYTFITVVLPIIFFVVVIGYWTIRTYGSDFIRWLKRKFRRVGK